LSGPCGWAPGSSLLLAPSPCAHCDARVAHCPTVDCIPPPDPSQRVHGHWQANNGAQVAVRAEVKNSVFRQNEATQYPTFGGGTCHVERLEHWVTIRMIRSTCTCVLRQACSPSPLHVGNLAGFGSYMLAPAAPVALPISYTFEGVVAVGNKGGSGAGIGMKHFLHGTGHGTARVHGACRCMLNVPVPHLIPPAGSLVQQSKHLLTRGASARVA
jgi:hypothetical protein